VGIYLDTKPKSVLSTLLPLQNLRVLTIVVFAQNSASYSILFIKTLLNLKPEATIEEARAHIDLPFGNQWV
jgi:hypothetical protein